MDAARLLGVLMSSGKFSGFVLSSLPISDSRHLVTLYTAEDGKCKGVLRVGKQHPRAYLMPLNWLEFQLSGREGQDLRTMNQVTMRRSVFNWSSDYMGLCLAQHWAELISRSQGEHQRDEGVFRLLQHSLEAVAVPSKDDSIALKNLYFETWLLHFCGAIARVRKADDLLPALGAYRQSYDTELQQQLGGAMARLFQQRIEQFAGHAVECEALTRIFGLVGEMWQLFLDAPVKVRPTLIELFKQRRFL